MVPTGKTPISYLQELCNKNGNTPQYDVIANEGASVHQPEFVIQVAVGEKVTTGRGSSKKKAKHAAAFSLLQKLSGKSDVVEDNVHSNGSVDDDTDANGQNPIGELQEFTQKNQLKPPEFIFSENKTGLPTDVEFRCTVKLGKLTETGTGSSKKAAKRNAACNMLTFIKSMNSVKRETIHDEEEEEEDLQLIIDIKNKIEQAKQQGKTTPVSDAETADQINRFYQKIIKTGCATLVKVVDGNTDYVKMVQDIAHSQSFEIRYIDVEVQSKSGQFQCLLQLSTLPVAVVHGTGATIDEARSAAAHNALQYLKVMLRDL